MCIVLIGSVSIVILPFFSIHNPCFLLSTNLSYRARLYSSTGYRQVRHSVGFPWFYWSANGAWGTGHGAWGTGHGARGMGHGVRQASLTIINIASGSGCGSGWDSTPKNRKASSVMHTGPAVGKWKASWATLGQLSESCDNYNNSGNNKNNNKKQALDVCRFVMRLLFCRWDIRLW